MSPKDAPWNACAIPRLSSLHCVSRMHIVYDVGEIQNLMVDLLSVSGRVCVAVANHLCSASIFQKHINGPNLAEAYKVMCDRLRSVKRKALTIRDDQNVTVFVLL